MAIVLQLGWRMGPPQAVLRTEVGDGVGRGLADRTWKKSGPSEFECAHWRAGKQSASLVRKRIDELGSLGGNYAAVAPNVAEPNDDGIDYEQQDEDRDAVGRDAGITAVGRVQKGIGVSAGNRPAD